MVDGILIGKFNKVTSSKVPTFFLNNRTYYYGTGNNNSYSFKIKTCSTSNPGVSMFQAGPVILAFWSDDA